MARKDVWRLVGTGLLTIATAVPYAAGIWSAWENLFSRLPMPIGILATIGAVLAPVQLVRDVMYADRMDRKTGKEQKPETE